MDLLKKMLCAFPQARITSQKALLHSYFLSYHEEPKVAHESPAKEPHIFNNVIQNLTDYR